MTDRELHGVPASPGAAVGRARRARRARRLTDARIEPARARRRGRARPCGARRRRPRELEALAARLRAEGRAAEAEIVETGALMARDPGARRGASRPSIAPSGRPPPAAILDACGRARRRRSRRCPTRCSPRAPTTSAASDAARRGWRAARRRRVDRPRRDAVLVADDLGPADVAELGSGRARRSRWPAAARRRTPRSSRAVARRPDGRGLGDGPARRSATARPLVVDGGAGRVVARPVARARWPPRGAAGAARTRARARGRRSARCPPSPRRPRACACWPTSPAPPRSRRRWRGRRGRRAAPDRARASSTRGLADRGRAPARARARAGAAWRGRVATVRVLDFGGDKLPPFLAGDDAQRGIGLLLSAPGGAATPSCAAILEPAAEATRAARAAADGRGRRRARCSRAARSRGRSRRRRAVPPLGAMIETPRGGRRATPASPRGGFLSIGTNDLTASTLGVDRFAPGEAPPHHPRVLAAIARHDRAGAGAGIPVEVCGEAASDPVALPLLVGLGVDELSVGAARVGTVARLGARARARARRRARVRRARGAPTADEVEAIVAPVTERLVSAERGDAVAQRVDGERSVVAAGRQP